MDRSLHDLKGFSISLPICEKSTFIDDKNIKFLRPEILLYTRNALENFLCGTAE